MTRQANILLDFMSFSFGSNSICLREPLPQDSLYQRLICASLARRIYTTEGFQILGRRLVAIADHTHFARQMNAVEQASQLMLALPISKELKAIARYYQAVCIKREGDFDGARRLLERVAEEAPPKFRARAILTIGATYYERGEAEAALPFYLAAGKAARDCDLSTLARSQKMIAVVRSIHGDHKQALADLERLFPMVRALSKYYPAFYYEFLNSLAVELGEVGRINEAKAASAIALASPFASAYPEFAETRDELEAKRTSATPSIVAVSAAPEPAPSPKPACNRKPALARPLIRSAREKIFIQISIAITTLVIAHPEITRSTLERVRHSINPRGPPSRFQI